MNAFVIASICSCITISLYHEEVYSAGLTERTLSVLYFPEKSIHILLTTMLGFCLSSVLPILSVFGTMVPRNFLPFYSLSQVLDRVPNCWFGAVRPKHFYFMFTIFRKFIPCSRYHYPIALTFLLSCGSRHGQ
jgi:hypothetical protein